jgi:hypothetical protein
MEGENHTGLLFNQKKGSIELIYPAVAMKFQGN